MKPLPLDKLGWGWQSHKSALWWLGVLYRKPKVFKERLEELKSWTQITTALRLYAHFLPYMLLLILLGRMLVFGAFDVPVDEKVIAAGEAPVFQFEGISFAISGGVAFGIVFVIIFVIITKITRVIIGALSGGITFGIAFGIFFGIASGFTFGFAVAFAFAINGAIVGAITIGIAFGIAGGIAVGIAGGIAGGIAVGIALSVFLLRAYYQPLFWWLCWPKPLGRLYPYHPVAWDDLCWLPFPRLHLLLVAWREHAPEQADREIERLIRDYPSQRKAALRAKTMVLGRQAAHVQKLTELDRFVANLPEGDKGFLAQTARVREWVAEISALQTRLEAITRPALRAPVAELLCAKIENFKNRVGGLHEPLAGEFMEAADSWLHLAERQRREVHAILSKEPTRQFFRAGDPVNREQEAFVPRERVLGGLQQQIELGTGCPGLVIYGRRRVGKSTLLQNLPGFLPESVVPVHFWMQSAEAFTSLGFFVDKLWSEIVTALKYEPEIPGSESPLVTLSRLLAACNQRLADNGQRLLLALDEYEHIDKKIGEGVFPQDLLAAIRESIQRHRRIVWAFCGGHHITELQHAEWTSYLISARSVEVPMFTQAETRLLLTDPMRYSSLWRGREEQRPRYEPGLWGENGIERMHAQAGGWPVLVQLIAETAIDLLNDENKAALDDALFERVLDRAVERGEIVFYELLRRESLLPGEWEYLAGFRRWDSQPPPEDEAIFQSLRRRLLVSEENGEWRLRVPLMARWLRTRG